MTTATKISVKYPTVLVVLLALMYSTSYSHAQSGSGTKHMNMMQGSATKKTQRVGLRGYCPVCIIEARKWERGRPEFHTVYDGVKYLFPSAAIKQKFDATPAKYVPALGGDCTVCYAKMGKRVPGSVQYAAIDKNRLYLFPSNEQKQMFLKDPTAFFNVDLAANGECVVCRKMANKRVPGSKDHAVIHDGLKYLFPSAKEARAFEQSPQNFVPSQRGTDKAVLQKTSAKYDNVATKFVSLSGKSGCAGCEYGVKPLGSPEELGLAVKTSTGKVVVIENAHKLYPKIYADRFEGQNLVVEGEILKNEGNYAWLSPKSVRVLN